MVSGVTRFGLFVMLPSGVEGLLPVEALPGQGWQYDESHLTLVREGGGVSDTFGSPRAGVGAAPAPPPRQLDVTLPGGDPAPRAARREKREEAPRPPRREKHRGNRRAMHVPKGRKGRKKR